MKKAIKAYSIGDKLYNIERLHSKLISFHIEYKKELVQIVLASLKKLVECFGEDIKNKYYIYYMKSIQNCEYCIENNLDYFENLCYMHGMFVLYRKSIKKILKKGCEINYHDVCYDLLIFELKRKKKDF